MPKNIVICCDGTGNEIEDKQSNVLKLYRILKKNNNQVVYYDPGVGTLGYQNDWNRFKQHTEKLAGLALGYGLDRNVLDAYCFLVQHYNENDRIFLFGFSRGAYTVRVIAGFINTVGLLRPEQINLAGYALIAYKQISVQEDFSSTRIFERTLRPRRPPIRFLGLWDTVSSIIVPRKDRAYIPSFHQLAYTARNPSVETVRHALAIDEKRRMFRPYFWQEKGVYWGGPFPSNNAVDQDIKQVWFPGVHSDIGGGYEEDESSLAKLALKWMIEESPTELGFVTQNVNQIALGKKRANSKLEYSKPSHKGKLHVSLKNGWQILEWIPKRKKFLVWPHRRSFLGFYLPQAEPRFISEEATLHVSVLDRKDDTEIQYDPDNLPKSYSVEGKT